MAKRSAWTTQDRQNINRIATAHSKSPISPLGAIAIRSNNTPIDSISPADKLTMIKAAANQIAVSVKRDYADVPDFKDELRMLTIADIRHRLRKDPESLPVEQQNFAVSLAIPHLIEDEMPKITDRMLEASKAYLSERGFSLNEAAVRMALKVYIAREDQRFLLERLNLQAIERAYVRVQKRMRQDEIIRAEAVNAYTRIICSGLKFTAHQRKSVKRFVDKEFDNLERRKLESLTLLTIPGFPLAIVGLADSMRTVETAFINSARERFSNQFKPPQKKAAAPAVTPSNGSTKAGTRKERKETYVPREKSPDRLEMELGTLAEASRKANVPFNSARYCISEIERKHPATAKSLSALFEAGLVNTHSITSLYASGSPAQKAFIFAIEKCGFQTALGRDQLDALAKGLAFLGRAKNRTVAHTKQAFRTPKTDGSLTFNFLKNCGLIKPVPNEHEIICLSKEL